MIKKALYFSFTLTCFTLIAFGQDDPLKGKELYSSDFVIDGIARTFTYYMPVNYGRTNGYPLLIILHNLNENAGQLIKKYGEALHAKADSTDCIIVYPDAVDGRWNISPAIVSGAVAPVNDVRFISILIEYFVQQYGADAKRIYASGFNNGAAMACYLGCNVPLKIAAVAAFGLSTGVCDSCSSSIPVAVINAKKTAIQNAPGFTGIAITEMWDFFMAHTKK
ncbi:MAG TPA: PHB depolymerase family esterase [Panacibacter sp.]|nr:PHB depolymerase family esterase [Panacibacter sp.]